MEFTDQPVLSVRDACIHQEGNMVLSDVDFDIGKGEFVYLIGKTGSGKSSLLKTLYADIPLKTGNILFSGTELKGIKRGKVPALRRKLGIIFQDFQLLTDRTVNENLLFVLKATGWKDTNKMKQRLHEVLMRVGLGTSVSKYPYQLSGGEQQRVVIARAMLNEPQLLIADEPTGNLDPEVSDEILHIFEEINHQGTAILMATHDFRLIEKFPHRILKVVEGTVKETTSLR